MLAEKESRPAQVFQHLEAGLDRARVRRCATQVPSTDSAACLNLERETRC